MHWFRLKRSSSPLNPQSSILHPRRGFSLVEMLITIAVGIILAAVGIANLVSRKSTTDLNDATKQIGALLREAQSHAMSDDSGVAWGVHFSNSTNTSPFYALFETSYSTSTMQGYYRLPVDVGYLTSTLASGSSTDITFAQNSGASSVSTSISLYLIGQNKSSTISVASSGEVSF